VQFGNNWATPEALRSFRRKLKKIMEPVLEPVKEELVVDIKSAQV
jgi:hypothetical protein